MNPVVHFEMPAEDRKRMSDFYTKAFGWKTQQLGQEFGDYVMVMTTESDEKSGKPMSPGAINGGFFQKMDDPKMNHPSVVIGIDDIKEAIEKVKEAGGKIVTEPMEIPTVGWYASFSDTEGNRVGMIQSAMSK